SLFKDSNKVEAKSAGLAPYAEKKLTKQSIEWADKIFVMEHEHKIMLFKMFPDINKEVVVLNINNDYSRGDKELVEVLRRKLGDYLG
ncbi:MAG: protein tyrosine phosphatase, partial [Nanoarchaeota archaeon]|nr:protein tyrosine phosphatase [Nanoarchaeota archaeon]